MSIFGAREWAIASIVLIAVLGLLIPRNARSKERNSRDTSDDSPKYSELAFRIWVVVSLLIITALGLAVWLERPDPRVMSSNNLKRFALSFRMYANIGYEKTGGNPKGLYPPLSSLPGILQMDPNVGLSVIQLFEYDVDIFISPGHPESRSLLQRAKADPASAVTDKSYWYLGYALPDEERGMAFVEWYREQAAHASIPSPSLIEEGDVRIYRLRAEIDLQLFRDDLKAGKIATPRDTGQSRESVHAKFDWRRLIKGERNVAHAHSHAIAYSKVPTMIERPGLFKGGGHVLYADGNTRFLAYPGEYPMTREFIEALESLGGLRPASVTR